MGAWRSRGLRLIAPDVDWTHGHGPEVRGGGAALLMSLAKGRAAFDELTGPGLLLHSGALHALVNAL